MKVKTSDLTGAALDWAVYILEGGTDTSYARTHMDAWPYSTNWSQGGPIIEREKIDIEWEPNGKPWCMARLFADKRVHRQLGPSPLIAAMRCFVASKLGAEIDIPEELV